jgi:hypothetical protein
MHPGVAFIRFLFRPIAHFPALRSIEMTFVLDYKEHPSYPELTLT